MKAFNKVTIPYEKVKTIFDKADEILSFPSKCTAHAPSTYKKICKAIRYDVPNSKFQALSGLVTVDKSLA